MTGVMDGDPRKPWNEACSEVAMPLASGAKLRDLPYTVFRGTCRCRLQQVQNATDTRRRSFVQSNCK